jgi:NAD+ synthase (glutamine-hydrolysing)
MAQVNPVVGDIDGNAAMIKNAVEQSLRSDVDVVVFPEMVLTGYPVEDLALRPAFRKASQERVRLLAQELIHEHQQPMNRHQKPEPLGRLSC